MRQRFFRWLWRRINPRAIRRAKAGKRPFAIVRHVGRTSGKVYETPIIVAPAPGGFVCELTYGDQVDWYRNIVAAGGCELIVGGATHRVVAVEPFDEKAGRRAFPRPARVVLWLLRRREYRFLRTAD